MALWVDVLRAATVLNVVLLAALTVIWARNYRQFRSKHTLGLSVFALLLLAENVVTVYVFGFDPLLTRWIANSAPLAQLAMAVVKSLEFAALAVLTWTAWD